MKTQFKSTRALAIATLFALSIPVAHAQVFGGVGGGIGGALSGPRNFGGAMNGGFGATSQFGANGLPTRTIRDRTMDRAKSTTGSIESSARNDMHTTKRATSNVESRASSGINSAKEKANPAVSSSADVAGGAASSAKSFGSNAAAEGFVASNAEANRDAAALSGSGEAAGSLTRVTPTPTSDGTAQPSDHRERGLPKLSGDGDASANANVSRGPKHMPKAGASADANGSASVSR